MSATPLLLTLVLVTACDRREQYSNPPALAVTAICDEEQSPDQTCESALRKFAADHNDERVTSLVTIGGSRVSRGMLVVHTSEPAPYPLLRDVRVVATKCDSLESCRSAVKASISSYPDAAVWTIVSDTRDESIMHALTLLGPHADQEVR